MFGPTPQHLPGEACKLNPNIPEISEIPEIPTSRVIAQCLVTFSPRKVHELPPAFQQLRSKLLALQAALQLGGLAPGSDGAVEHHKVEP